MRFHKLALVAASMSFAMAPTMAKASTCQPGGAGCVLPLPGPPAAPPPVNTPPPPADVGVPIVEESSGFGALPFIIGAVVLAAIAAFFLFDEDDEEPATP